jgi:ABC-type dipeptide/oligopeptide/nickel transport system permease subunit
MPSWGNMLNEGQRDIARGIWWTTLFPGMMIVRRMRQSSREVILYSIFT